MTNQPLTPAQSLLTGLRELAFEGSPGRWVAVMLMLSIPVAFGMAIFTFISTWVEALILPVVTLPLRNLLSWMIPLGSSGGLETAPGIYLGMAVLALIKLVSTIVVLFLLVRLLKALGSRPS